MKLKPLQREEFRMTNGRTLKILKLLKDELENFNTFTKTELYQNDFVDIFIKYLYDKIPDIARIVFDSDTECLTIYTPKEDFNMIRKQGNTYINEEKIMYEDQRDSVTVTINPKATGMEIDRETIKIMNENKKAFQKKD